MFTLTTVIPPGYQYLENFTLVILVALFLGAILWMIYPSQKNKIALFWVIIGIFQIFLSALYMLPYVFVFNLFPNAVVYGLFILTCGILLVTLNVRFQKPRRLLGLSFLILALMESIFFIDFYFKFPNLTAWNITINATPAISFLIATIITLSCAVFACWKSIKFSLPSRRVL